MQMQKFINVIMLNAQDLVAIHQQVLIKKILCHVPAVTVLASKFMQYFINKILIINRH